MAPCKPSSHNMTPLLDRIEQLAGPAVAQAIRAEFGGLQVYIPGDAGLKAQETSPHLAAEYSAALGTTPQSLPTLIAYGEHWGHRRQALDSALQAVATLAGTPQQTPAHQDACAPVPPQRTPAPEAPPPFLARLRQALQRLLPWY